MPVAGALRGWRRAAFARPHVLLLEGLGGTAIRLSVERAARDWGWPLAASPADADLVVTCGIVPSAPLARVVGQTPLPRRLVQLYGDDGAIRDRLLAAREALRGNPLDDMLPAADEHEEEWPVLATSAASSEDAGAEHHGGHGDHGGQGDGMEMPAGLMMAGTAPDRDGLALDVLHVSLGPLLPWWPGGLRLDLDIQGDVVQAATVRLPPSGSGERSFWREPWHRAERGEAISAEEALARRAAANLDGAARLLRLAGHERDAATASRRRDALLADSGADVQLADLFGAVRHDILLRAMLRDVARAEDGDAWQRLLGWLDEAERVLRTSRPFMSEALDRASAPHSSDREVCAGLPRMVTGQDVAAARLTVASLDPDVNAALTGPRQ